MGGGKKHTHTRKKETGHKDAQGQGMDEKLETGDAHEAAHCTQALAHARAHAHKEAGTHTQTRRAYRIRKLREGV